MTSMRGIFWFDPGKSTGIAWGIFDLKSKTVADAMRDKLCSGSVTVPTSGHTMDDAAEHARAIWAHWSTFKRVCVQQGLMEPDAMVLGAEHFILHSMHSKGVEGIFPAYVLGAFEGYRQGLFDGYRPRKLRHYTPLILQTASVGMKYNNQKFLKGWDAWVVGKEHERAAFAHIGAYLMAHLT